MQWNRFIFSVSIMVQRCFLLIFLPVISVQSNAQVDLDNAPSWPKFDHVEYLNPEKYHRIGEIPFTDCRVSDVSDSHFRQLECGYLSVPENYNDPQGAHITLFLGRLKASGKKTQPDAFLPISGGPGSAASESYLFPNQGFDKILQQRDIYILDQRGTGKSNKLDCQNLPDDIWSLSGDNEIIAQMVSLYAECLTQLPNDPSQYTTSVAVNDIETVRAALGLAAWNIYGASYGTRVAQHYLRQYPNSVRTLVLDAVVHPSLSLGPNIILDSDRALKKLIARCEASEACQQQFPSLAEGVNQFITDLKANPINVTFEDIASSQTKTITLHAGHVIAFIRMSLYSQDSAAIIPLLLHEAYANKNYAPLARNAQLIMQQMNAMISMGMHNTVMCTEDYPFLDINKLNRKLLAETYIGDDGIELFFEMCSLWPAGPIDPEFKQPLKSNKPVLLLSGSADPITPPAYAQRAAKLLTNSVHIVGEQLGHGLASKGCVPTLMAKFINAASPKGLNGECLSRYTPAPFFLNFNGPSP